MSRKRIGNEEATEQSARARNDRNFALWEHLKDFYAPRVQGVVRAAIENGGLSLPLIEVLELAEHERLYGEIQQLRAKSESGQRVSTAIAVLYGLRLQCRKHARVCRIAMNPLASPNDMAHPMPESVAEALAALRDYEPDPGDDGDDLMS